MLTKSTDWQSVEKARKQGNFASGKICRRRRLDLTIPKGSANPPKEAALASKGVYMDVSGRRRQVQLTQEAKIVSDLSGRFLRLWALSTVWRPGVFPAPFCSMSFACAAILQATMRQRSPAFAGNRNGAARFAAMRERRRDWMAARLLRTSFCRSARQMRAKERAARRKTQSKRPWAEILRCHSLCAVVSFSYAAGVCAGAVGVALASGEAPGDAMRMGVMTSPPRTPKLSVSGKR